MFTGIVEACTAVQTLEALGGGARLRLALPLGGWSLCLGDSLAVSGACLTVVGLWDRAGQALPSPAENAFGVSFDLSAETLSRTTLGALTPGSFVNLERALRLGDRLGGHLVSGHVDAQATLEASVDRADGGREYTFATEPHLGRYLIDKGSVTLDGVSLTVIEPKQGRFRVALIAHTLAVTTLGRARIGARLNLEFDAIGKWVERFVTPYA